MARRFAVLAIVPALGLALGLGALIHAQTSNSPQAKDKSTDKEAPAAGASDVDKVERLIAAGSSEQGGSPDARSAPGTRRQASSRAVGVAATPGAADDRPADGRRAHDHARRSARARRFRLRGEAGRHESAQGRHRIAGKGAWAGAADRG